MSIYINDPFNSMALGPGNPTDWNTTFGIVVAYSGSSGRGGVGGLYPGNNWFSSQTPCNTPSLVLDLGYSGGGPMSATMWFGFREESVPNGVNILVVYALNALENAEVALFTLYLEDDFSISGYSTSNISQYPPPYGNTGQGGFYFPPSTWYFCQLNISLGTITISGTQYVTVTIEFAIMGTVLLMAGPINTGVTVASLAFNAVDMVGWSGAPYIDISQIQLEDLVAIDDYPNPGTIINHRLNQFPVEVMTLPDNSNVRLNQFPTEVMTLPQTANVRASQLVIELATSGTTPPPPTGGIAFWSDSDLLTTETNSWTDYGD